MPEIAGAGRRKVTKKLSSPTIEPVADRVWLVRGGFPQRVMNVYLIEDGGGVTVFDAGIHEMTEGLLAAAEPLGGVNRVVLGHAHGDHRGAAPGLGAPVHCHPDEAVYAEAEFTPLTDYFDTSKLEKPHARFLMPRLLQRWDGGPVEVAGTLTEGDEVAGFEVKHFPGHAPGLIGLWRESDRLALVSDVVYTLDPQSLRGASSPPSVPHRAFNLDTEQARDSIRKLAALAPSQVWAGHADPVVGDCRAQLEHAADTTQLEPERAVAPAAA
jgi:glyoxylase-like metal-dependent hydrolase (beta-lactamase superfamily II)